MTRGHHRDAFAVHELDGPRFASAMELLGSGLSFEFADVAFQISPDGSLTCVVDSSWDLPMLTPSAAAKDLAAGWATFEYLLHSSSRFAAAVAGRRVVLQLVSDYGTGAVRICSDFRDRIEWSPGVFPDGHDVVTAAARVPLEAHARPSVSTARLLHEAAYFARRDAVTIPALRAHFADDPDVRAAWLRWASAAATPSDWSLTSPDNPGADGVHWVVAHRLDGQRERLVDQLDAIATYAARYLASVIDPGTAG